MRSKSRLEGYQVVTPQLYSSDYQTPAPLRCPDCQKLITTSGVKRVESVDTYTIYKLYCVNGRCSYWCWMVQFSSEGVRDETNALEAVWPYLTHQCPICKDYRFSIIGKLTGKNEEEVTFERACHRCRGHSRVKIRWSRPIRLAKLNAKHPHPS